MISHNVREFQHKKKKSMFANEIKSSVLLPKMTAFQ